MCRPAAGAAEPYGSAKPPSGPLLGETPRPPAAAPGGASSGELGSSGRMSSEVLALSPTPYLCPRPITRSAADRNRTRAYADIRTSVVVGKSEAGRAKLG